MISYLQRTLIIAFALLFGFSSTNSYSQTASDGTPTRVIIRALADDAKFIGSSMGGMRITIRNAQNGALIARGITEGGTGNTHTLVRQPHSRYGSLSESGDAGFDTTIVLKEPVLAEITAYGPLDFPQSAAQVSTTQWLIPGQDISDDGIILRIPGFVLTTHPDQQRVSLVNGEAAISFAIEMMMMCGCPIEPEGLWDSEPMEIKAELLFNGQQIQQSNLEYTGEPNWFSGEFKVQKMGSYTVRVVAFDPRTNNSAIDHFPVQVNE
jgi:hypothetical protein